jgi:hypothetical protein
MDSFLLRAYFLDAEEKSKRPKTPSETGFRQDYFDPLD